MPLFVSSLLKYESADAKNKIMGRPTVTVSGSVSYRIVKRDFYIAIHIVSFGYSPILTSSCEYQDSYQRYYPIDL